MTFVAKALKAARLAIKRRDCRHADYWLRQIVLRVPASAKTKSARKVQASLRSCYRRAEG